MVFLDRDRRAEAYPWLAWKIRLFVAGAVLAVVGMGLEVDWLVGVAVLLLVAAFLVRFLPGGRGLEADEADGS